MNTARALDEARYTSTAIALHWLIAALIVAGFTLGISMVGLPLSRQKLQWYAWHKWIGITVWLLSCARLAWRWRHAPPPPPPATPHWQAPVFRACHVGLNFTLLALVCLHVAAALKHHLVDKDSVLTRMLPAAASKLTL